MASSEDDKVPPTPSTLESVIEKPAENQTSDKLSDEGVETSEIDKTEEKKLTEVSDASNEDLTPRLIESKDLISQDPTEVKQEDGQAEEIQVPTEPVVSQPDESVNTADTEKLVTDGQETEEEQREEQEEKREDELSQVIEEEKDHEEMKKEEQKDAGTEKSREPKEQPEDAPEEPESVPVEVAQMEEESKEPGEEMPEHEVTEDKMEDTANGTDVNENAENIESNLMDTTTNGDTDTKLSVDESPAVVLLEEEAIESQPEEKHEDEAPEETEQPEQDNHPREDVEAEEQVPTASTNGVSDEARDTSEDSEQVVRCEDVPVKENEDEATRADENTSQDAVSVPESETDSESKIEHGSPAVIKPDVEKDSDSGSSSAADNNSLDLNLSISSFLSKSKEGGSVSMQVI